MNALKALNALNTLKLSVLAKSLALMLIKVSIKVYDLLGREVMNLISEFKQAGSYIVSFIEIIFRAGFIIIQ